MKTNKVSCNTGPQLAENVSQRNSLFTNAGVILLIFVSVLCQRASAQVTYALTNVWYVPTNVVAANNLIVPGDNNRSLAYDAISNQVFVAARGGGAPAPGIEVLDAANGNFLGLLNKTAVSGGSIAVLNQIGAADDGAIYAANWTSPTPASLIKLYRWTNWLSLAAVAYAGNAVSNSDGSLYTLGTVRVGDTMAVRGAGANTQILLPVGVGGVTASTNMLLFTTADGLNFTNHILNINGFSAAGSGIYSATFYTNNTFLMRLAGGTGNNVLLIQYPANIASLGVGPIACTQIGSYSLPNVLSTTAFLSYKSPGQGGLMAVVSPQNSGGVAAVAQVALYSDPVVGSTSCSIQQASTNYPHLVTNGNLAGAAALGGAGFAQYIFSLDCNNGVRCSGITTIPAQPPTISTQPVGATAYTPYTLSLTAGGFCPLVYQWQATNNAGGFTNIPGATASSYTITSASTNYYRVVVTNTISSITSSVVLVTARQATTNAAITQLWRDAAGSFAFLSTSDNNGRGIGYDTNSDRVVVAVANATTPSLNVLNGTTGASLGAMGITGLTSGGTFAVDQIGIADDGVVYSCNLGYNAALIINRWNSTTVGLNPNATPAYNGLPSGPLERYGDNMAVRGAGTNTQMLVASSANPGIGVGPATNVVLFTTTDGTNFTATVLGIAGVPGGFAGSGIAFDTGTNFWAKTYNGDLFKIVYDPSAGTGSVVLDYSSSGQVPQSTMGLGVDPSFSIMATIVQSDIPDDVQLFQLTGTADAPVLFHQAVMSNNGNANANGAIAMKNRRLYALDVNNGVVALSYGTPVGTPPSIVTPPAATTAYTNTTANLTVVASGTLTLNYQWRFNSNNIPAAVSSIYSIVNPPLSAAGYYDVIVRNASGSVTSTPVLLTVKIPVLSGTVTQMWTLAAGSRTYLDSTTYKTRGLAYDAVLGRLLVADHFNIYLLDATNNSDLGSMNMIGLPTTGFSQWLVDQVRVADDGVVYGCNLQDNSFGAAPLSIISWTSADPGGIPAFAYGSPAGADPSGIGARLGDTMGIRGAGASTEILMGTPDANIAVWLTNDVSNPGTFIPTVITVTNAPVGFASGGIAFGAGNTFWAKGGSGYDLREVTFDPASPATAAVSKSFTAGTQVPNTFTGLSVDVTNKILAGISFNDTPNDLQLYLLSGNTNPPSLSHQAFFPGAFINAQLNAASDIKYPWAFGLDVNNGIVALNYGAQVAPAVTITSVSYAPGAVTLNWNNTFNGHNYQVQRRSSFNAGAWANIGSPVTASGPTATYTDVTATGSSWFYRVISN